MGWNDVLDGSSRWSVEHSDCLDFLRSLPDNCIDSIVCDPPAGIAFMGARRWDSFNGDGSPRDKFTAYITEIFSEAIRVIKPGGHALVWALPKTSHWTTWGIESAGFEIKDQLFHVFGTGMPKTRDISEYIDDMNGDERPAIGKRHDASKLNKSIQIAPGGWETGKRREDRTAPGSKMSAPWEGWSTALKPSVESWILARKPLRGTVAQNVVEWGTGAINIGACRGETDSTPETASREGEKSADRRYADKGGTNFAMAPGPRGGDPDGRWPSHLLLSHSPDCKDGSCADGCPVWIMDQQSGTSKSSSYRPNTTKILNTGSTYGSGTRKKDWKGVGDSGGASRYFTVFKYAKKAAVKEKNRGCEGLFWQIDKEKRSGITAISREAWQKLEPAERTQGNVHNTVKSIELMSWLTRLVTPVNGVCLDLFGGSFTTGIACMKEGFRFLGVEREAEYVMIGQARMHAWEKDFVEPQERNNEQLSLLKIDASSKSA